MVEPDDSNEGLPDLDSCCWWVCHDAARRLKRVAAACRIAFRGISVRSEAAMIRIVELGGNLSRACRKTSRRSRFVRVRTVPFPARRPTAKSNPLLPFPFSSMYPTNGWLNDLALSPLACGPIDPRGIFLDR